jgi:predicted P-loop ATPase
VVKVGELPWSKLVNSENGDLWEDNDDAELRYYIEKVYGISCPQRIDDARLVVQGKNRFHPVRNYLNSLAWDGIERAEAIFIDYLGAEDCPYTRAVTRKMLAAACARVFQPGIKFDYMLVLTGEQGAGKGQVLKLLGGRWYSDSIMTISGKEGLEQLQGVWILEMGELSALKRTSVEHIKQYISKGEDYFRPAYGKHVILFQRQCVIFGTTNDLEFLRDQTGNRRFWPVAVSAAEDEEKWRKLTNSVVDQIWAEAYEIYKKGEELYLKGELEKEAIKRQEYHTETSINEGLIIKYLELLLPEEWEKMNLYERRGYIQTEESKRTKEGVKPRTKVCAAEIWTELLKGELKDSASKVFIRDIHASLCRIEGWKPYRRGTGKLRFSFYGPQKAYIKIGGSEDV